MPATTTTALADRAEDGARVVAPAAIGASALVAGSLLWTLTRLRARQARRRRPGRDNPLPGPDLVKVERALRGEAAEQPVAWVDATLRLLTVRLRARPAGAQPVALLALYVTEETVELLLGQPDGEPPTGFLASDDGYTWRLDPELALQAVQAEADGATPLAPATVTLGSTDQGLLLVNLEQLALLRIQGPAEVAQPFLSGLAVELATAPWAASVTLHPVVDDDDPIARLPRARPVAALHDIAGGLQTQADATRNAIGAEATTAAARTAPDGEDWPPTVVILRRSPAGAQALQALSKAAQQPGSGLALTVVGDVDDATWRLQLRDDGTASLEPLGLEIMLSGLDDADAAAAADLLAVASEEDIARPTRIHAQHSEPAADRERSDDGAAAVPVSLGPLPVEITVLGPVSVTGWEAREVRPQFAEIVTYLAMHDRPVPTDALRTALWPEGIHYNTFKNVVSRTRQALGSDGEGNYHLPEARDGRYRVGPEVGCDWNRFQGLVRAARIAAPRQSVALLRSALELIEGRPFQGSPAGTYQWAFDEQFVSAIEVAAVDAAHRLAELALDADDPDTAIWATRRGHLVVPDHEGLYRTRMRAYARRGDVDGVEQTFREALRAARAYDALDDVQPETRQLYDELVRPQRASRGA